MGNTALKAIIGADASPFVSAMKTVEAISTKAGMQTAAALRQAEKALVEASAATDLTVRQTNFYAQALAGVRAQLEQVTAAERAATTAANSSAEARAMAARKNPGLYQTPLTGSEVTRTTNNAGRIAALRAEIAEKKRLQALDAERAGMVTGSEVTRTTNNAGRIAALRAEIAEKKRLQALDAERAGMVTGSEVTRTTPDTARLAALRAAMMGGGSGAEAARIEIRRLAELRRSNRGGGPGSIGGGLGGASSAMFISVARDSAASLASGANPLTVFMQQAPQVAQAFTMMGGKVGGTVTRLVSFLKGVPWLFVGAWALALGSIAAGFLIFRARVSSLVKDMVGPLREAFDTTHIAKYLQKAGLMAELQKDITAEVRRTREAHDSVIAALDRQLELTRDRIGFEKELLEIQKANELAGAKTPAQREAIEKKYSGLILAKKKEERDAELKHLKDIAAKLPAEIAATQDAIKKAIGGNFMSEAKEKQLADEARAKSAVYDDYRKQLKPGENDKRDFSLERDRATISEIAEEKRRRQRVVDEDRSRTDRQMTDQQAAAFVAETPAEEQAITNATGRMFAANQTKSAEETFANGGGDRARERARVKELEDKVKADEKRLAELGSGSKGEIADKARANLQRDREDLRLEQERLKRTDSPGSSGTPREITSNQRLGAYVGGPAIALLDVTKSMDRKLSQIVQNTSSIGGGGGRGMTVGGLKTR